MWSAVSQYLPYELMNLQALSAIIMLIGTDCDRLCVCIPAVTAQRLQYDEN